MSTSTVRTTILRMLTCLAAGVIISMALAWTMAWLRPLPREWPGLFSVDARNECWMGFGQYGPGWSHLTLYGASGLTDAGRAAARTLPSWIDPPRDGDSESRCLCVIGAGWPMTSFRAQTVGVGHADPPPGRGWHSGLGPQWVEWNHWRGALAADNALPTNPSSQRVLPIGLVWRGLAVNVAFWSAVCALPMLLIAGRRLNRMRRGRCPVCGYDLRRDMKSGCAECGWRREP